MKTVFGKLLASFVLTILICLLIAGGSLSFMIRNYLSEQKETELVVKAQEIAQSTRQFYISNENPHAYINTINHLDSYLGGEVWAIDREGIVIAAATRHLNYEGNKLSQAERMEMQSGKLSVHQGYSEYFKDPVIRVTAPILEQDKVIGAIIVYSPVKGIDEANRKLALLMVFAAVISLAVAFLFCFFTAKGIAKPVQRMAEASMGVAEENRFIRVSASTDFKEFNQLAHAFNRMIERLEENEKRMKDFVANVSHELKSPLTSIKGFTEALIDGKGSTIERTQKFLGIMDREANRLMQLIDNLLILCRMDSNIKIEPRTVNIQESVKETITEIEGSAIKKGVVFKLKVSDEKYFAVVDPFSLKQILINLLDNAVKYSPNNSEIMIEIKNRVDREGIEVSIEDNGQGIPEEDLIHIWDRFYRVDKARSRETGGTGLGLAIVRDLVIKNKGTVQVESTVGKGTLFRFTLPSAE